MRAGMRQRPTTTHQRAWRLLAISLVLSLLFGLAGMGEPIEKMMRIARNKANPISASGDIVVVTIDDPSQKAIGAWPWSREVFAGLVDRVTAAGASKILIDVSFNYKADKVADAAFAKALEQSRRVVLPINPRSGQGAGQVSDARPEAMLARHVQLGIISIPYDYDGMVWSAPFGMNHDGRHYPSFSSIMSGVDGRADTLFPVNYRINIDSIPRYSALQLAKGEIGDRLRGKTVIIGATSETIGDIFVIPGRGRRGGVFVHVLGAETLKRGVPLTFGWLPMLLAMIPFVVMAVRVKRVRAQTLTLTAALFAALAVPIVSESRQWFVDITPALFLLACVASALTRRRFRVRGMVNLSRACPIWPRFVALRINAIAP